jgi:acyl-CoA synthetase (AMP-forming)/AMP-acid ligase II
VEQLKAQLRSSLASFAVPSRWQLRRDRLPTNDSGKVDKTTLNAQARKDLAQQPAKAAV